MTQIEGLLYQLTYEPKLLNLVQLTPGETALLCWRTRLNGVNSLKLDTILSLCTQISGIYKKNNEIK